MPPAHVMREATLDQVEFEQLLSGVWLSGGGEAGGVAFRAVSAFAYARYTGTGGVQDTSASDVGESEEPAYAVVWRRDSRTLDEFSVDQVDAWIKEALR